MPLPGLSALTLGAPTANPWDDGSSEDEDEPSWDDGSSEDEDEPNQPQRDEPPPPTSRARAAEAAAEQKTSRLEAMLPDELIAAVLEKAASGGSPFDACAEVARWCSVNQRHAGVCRRSEDVWAEALRAWFDEHEVGLFVAHHPDEGAATPWRNRFNAACGALRDALLRVHEVRIKLALNPPIPQPTAPWHRDIGLVVAIEGRLTDASPRLRSSRAFVLEHFPSLPEGTAEELKSDVAFVAKAALRNPLALSNAASPLKGTQAYREAAIAATMHDWRGFLYARAQLQDNRDVMQYVVQQRGVLLEHASPRLREHKPTVLLAVANESDALPFASFDLRDDEDVVLTAVRGNGRTLQYASERLKDAEVIVLAAVSSRGEALEHASVSKRKDKRVVMAAVEKNGRALDFVMGSKLPNDREVLAAALAHPYNVVRWDLRAVALGMLRDQAVVRRLAKAGNPKAFMALKYKNKAASGPLQTKELALTFVGKVERIHLPKLFDQSHYKLGGEINEASFSYWRNDRDVVLAALKRNGEVLKSLVLGKSLLLNDDAIFKQAVETTPSAVQYVPVERLSDELMTIAVTQKGMLIYRATDAQKQSATRLVHAALRQNGLVLDALPAFQDQQATVLIAVKQNGLALQYASPRLQDTLEVALEAMKQTRAAKFFVRPTIANDPKYWAALEAENQRLMPELWKKVQASRAKAARFGL